MKRETKKYPLKKTFFFAFSGLARAVRSERNIQIHLSVGLLVILTGLFVGLSQWEWAVVILTIFLILATETFNSALEEICNLLRDKLKLGYEETKTMRNLSAGAVLLLAIASVIIGLIIFLPKFLVF